MRTSFRDSLKKKPIDEPVKELKKEIPDEVKEDVESKKSKKSKKGKKDNIDKGVDETQTLDKGEEDGISDLKPKKKKRGFRVVLTMFLLVILVGAGVYVYSTTGGFDSTSEKIQGLYTTPQKEDIRPDVTLDTLDTYYASAGDDEELVTELDTISRYLEDRDKLSEVEDETVKLSDAILVASDVSDSVVEYTVTGLALTMASRVDTLVSEYDEYMKIKAELVAVTDFNNFDKTKYDDRIAKITHTADIKELTDISNILQKTKDASNGLAVLQGAELEAKNAEIAKQAEELKKYKSDLDKYQKKTDALINSIQETVSGYLPIEKIDDESNNSVNLKTDTANQQGQNGDIVDQAQDKLDDVMGSAQDTVDTIQEQKGMVEGIIDTIKGFFGQ